MSGPAGLAKRSVMLAGHATSLSLEQVFWDCLRRFAAADGTSINRLVTAIDRDREGNLSSAVRVYVVTRLMQGSSQVDAESTEGSP